MRYVCMYVYLCMYVCMNRIQMASSEENTLFSMQKKKMFLSQCREVKGQKDEAEMFKQKQTELSGMHPFGTQMYCMYVCMYVCMCVSYIR